MRPEWFYVGATDTGPVRTTGKVFKLVRPSGRG
jgi:hypothetical protein